MSDEPEFGLENDHFVTIDDHILFAGRELEAKLNDNAEAFVACMDEIGRDSFEQVAEVILKECQDERAENPETLEIARRTFLFAKLIGYYALYPHPVRSFLEKVSDEESDTEHQNPLEAVISASRLEWRDSAGFKSLVNEHRSKLDPSGSHSDIVDLFAGFALLNMNNALYFTNDDLEGMQASGRMMAQATDEDWQQGLNELLAE